MSNPERRYVIVGTGAAGIAAAEAIRKADPAGDILLVSEEADGYYSRPGLAYFLTGEISEKMLYPFSKRDFKALGVRLLRARAVNIHRDARLVEMEHGATVPYDRLLIAVGAAANRASFPGSDLAGVVKLDTIDDARRMIKLSRRTRAAVVVGGGITALEIVEGLRARGVKVHYFLRKARYWRNVLDETESKIVEHKLMEEGVKIHYHTELAEILERRGRVAGVLTKDGRTIKCQMVAIAIGVRPRIALAQAAGLEVERGVLVDEYLRTSDPYIYAAGDVAQVYDPFSGKSVVDSLWGPARDQGWTAGLNMTGRKIMYTKLVPFNVTRLAGLTTTIIGTVGKGTDDDLVGIARGDSETWRQLPDAIAAQDDFEVNRLRMMIGERRLLGAIVMGDQTLSQPLHRLIANKADISSIRDELLRPQAPLADLIADFWVTWRQKHAPQ